MTDRVKRPAFQWYPGDWRRDTALQSCSIAARGLWVEMLNLMHDGEPYGHLTAGGVPLSTQGLANLTGLSPSAAKKLIAELEEKKVFSRTADGTIYSRRMVRDEDIRSKRANAGKLGGNPALLGSKDNREVGERLTKKDNQNPTPASAVAVAVAVASHSPLTTDDRFRLCAAANAGLEQHPTHPQPIPRILPGQGSTIEAIEIMAAGGVPIEFADQAVLDIAKSHNSTKGVGGLKYFANKVVERWEAHLLSQQPKPRANGTNGNGAHARDALTDRARVVLSIATEYNLLTYSGNAAEYRARIDRAAADPRAGEHFREEIAGLRLHDGIGSQEEKWAVVELTKRLRAAQAVPA